MFSFVYMIVKKIVVLLLTVASVICFAFLPAYAKKPPKYRPTRQVEIEASDELILHGVMELPKSATIENKVPLVIMLHSIGGRKENFDTLVEDLRSRDIASLRIDMRGHATSIEKLDGTRVYWQQFRNDEFKLYTEDIKSTIEFVKESFHQINPEKIAIIASDISANASVVAAAENKENIKNLILLSPSRSRKNIVTPVKLVEYDKNPLLIIVSEQDKYHLSEAKELVKYSQGENEIKVLKYGQAGDMMLKLNPNTKSEILAWIDKTFRDYDVIILKPEQEPVKTKEEIMEEAKPVIPPSPKPLEDELNYFNILR